MTSATKTRIQPGPAVPAAYQAMLSLNTVVEKAAADAGIDRLLVKLVKLRASQLNGCAYCLDMHSEEALKAGEDPRRIFVLEAWRETDLYSDQERVALDLAEAMTGLTDTHGVSDELYEKAMGAFTEDQYAAVMWLIVVINSWNRVAIPGRPELPGAAR